MKILVVSDTHRSFDALKAVTEKCADFDALIHLGDGENEFGEIQRLYPDKGMIYVGGNCDFGLHETVHTAKFGDVGIFCCHGHTLGVKYGTELLVAAAKQNNCQIALYGHTHIYQNITNDGISVMNPGSPILPRGGKKPSFGVITIEPNGEIKTEIVLL